MTRDTVGVIAAGPSLIAERAWRMVVRPTYSLQDRPWYADLGGAPVVYAQVGDAPAPNDVMLFVASGAPATSGAIVARIVRLHNADLGRRA
jgi:hypothetical protein